MENFDDVHRKEASKFVLKQAVIASCRDKLSAYLSSVPQPYPSAEKIAELVGIRVNIVKMLLKERGIYQEKSSTKPEKTEIQALNLTTLFAYFDEFKTDVFPPISVGDYEAAAEYFGVEQKEVGQLISDYETSNTLSQNRALWNKYVSSLILKHSNKNHWEIALLTGFCADYVKKIAEKPQFYTPLTFAEKLCFIKERFLINELNKHHHKLDALKEIDDLLRPLIELPNKKAIPQARDLMLQRKITFHFDSVKLYERLNLLRRANGIMRAPLLHPESQKSYKENKMRKNWRDIFDKLIKENYNFHIQSELDAFEQFKHYILTYTKQIACFDLSIPFDLAEFENLIKSENLIQKMDDAPAHIKDLKYIIVNAEQFPSNFIDTLKTFIKSNRKLGVKLVLFSFGDINLSNENIPRYYIKKGLLNKVLLE